jgi:crotonobetainyl-CoA:carnitine CoA-transferase CaiB-like acyl-CoA transferase
MMSLPLEGIRVIDLGQIFAVPYCTLQLAYLGAEVIKVEPPRSGDQLRRPETSLGGVSYPFLMLNANKKSVALNLKDLRGREIFFRMLERTDVLAENYSGGVMESFGLGYDDLKERFPRLIHGSCKGYGSDGPWATLGAMDSTMQASCGLISVTGYPDRPGVKTPATFIDMGSGSHLVSGILAALIQRAQTGRGQKVEVAMMDTSVSSMTGLIGDVLEGRKPERLGNRHRNACPSNVYPAADGQIMIFCLTEKHWWVLARLMGRGDLSAADRFRNHRARMVVADEVDALVAGWTGGRRRDELAAILSGAGVPCAPVRTVEEVAGDPEITRQGMLADSEFPTRGPIKVTGLPIKFSQCRAGAQPVSRPPLLGEHTAEVLAGLGVGSVELRELRDAGVI